MLTNSDPDEQHEFSELNEIYGKYPHLTLELLVDIYGVHKALLFGQFQRKSYPIKVFIADVEKAENITLGGDEYSETISENEELFALSFYPLYLVNDNVFDVMACHYAVSSVVNQMISGTKNVNGLQIRSVVVPKAMCSRYDVEDLYEPTIQNLTNYLPSISSSKLHVTRRIGINMTSLPEMTAIIDDMMNHVHSDSVRKIAIVFNRQRQQQNDLDTVTIFECRDFSELVDLERNYFVSFHFDISGGTSPESRNVVRCWLIFGMGQRLRFYPEYVVWIIPNLFVRSRTMTTYRVVQKLYGEDYKHGWRVALDDEIFNKYYHIITGYKHVSVNYNRDEVEVQNKYIDDNDCGLRDHLERTIPVKQVIILKDFSEKQAYDSEAILEDLLTSKRRIDAKHSNISGLKMMGSAILRQLKFEIFRYENIECQAGDVHNVDDCQYVESVIRNLQIFEDCNLEIDALTVIDFDLESIINGFDHMVRVHEFLSDDVKKLDIQNYITQQITCHRGARCKALRKHGDRKRERVSTDEKDQEPPHEVDAVVEATSDAIHSIHCYILHRNDNLYRLSGDKNGKFQSRFATEAVRRREGNDDDHMEELDDQKEDEKEDEEPLGINFGVNVLQWLPYGVQPHHKTLKEEFLKNPDSTIDQALLKHYLMLCIAKIKGTKFTANEMLCLKLYSDTNELQALLRRAHWTVTLLEVRRMYYQWAMGLYRTHLYHATPIPAASGKNKPCKLYHGLSQMFMMSHELPIYNGPFSTTIAKSVATTFCKEQGLIWMIQSTFANPLRFCIGISMDWISGFKHEHEVLLYNQFLPIQKTETFDDDPAVLAEHLIWSLQARTSPIMEANAFWNQLGIQFQAAWIPLIVAHKLFLEQTNCGDMIIFDRLCQELDIEFFKFMKMFGDSVKMTDSGSIGLQMDSISQTIPVSEYVFKSGLGTKVFSSAETQRFDDVADFEMSCEDTIVSNTNSLKYTIFAAAADDSFGYTPIYSTSLSRYRFSRSTPLMVTESVKIAPFDALGDCSGTLQIRTSSDLFVATNVTINGTGVGKSQSGGIIRLFAKGTVVNDGKLYCDGVDGGRGGAIYIVCDSFVNQGDISCEPDGRIYVFCKEYVDGTASPQPMVMKTKANQLVTSGTMMGDYPVSVVDYLLFCIQREFAVDVSKEDFYRTIGVEMQIDWIPRIVEHKLLYAKLALSDLDQFDQPPDPKDPEKVRFSPMFSKDLTTTLQQDIADLHNRLHIADTEYDGTDNVEDADDVERAHGAITAKGAAAVTLDALRVIDVLRNHLEFGFFKFYDAVRSALVLDDAGAVVFRGDGKGIDNVQREISEHIFMIRNENENESKVEELRFERASEFKIPRKRSLKEMAISPLHVYVKPVNGSIDFVRVKSLLKTMHVFVENKSALRINKSLDIPPADRRRGQSGSVHIGCSSDIEIGQNVLIKGAETMMNANGCEFRMITNRNITNKGTLSFNGLGDGNGGDIYIVSDSYVNDGKMECKSSSENGYDGRIQIFCRQFVNRGIITPDPRVIEWIPMEPMEYQSVSQSLSEWLPSRRSPEEYPSEWGVGSLPIKGNAHWELLNRNHEVWRTFERVCNLGNASEHINAVWRWRGEDDENMVPPNGKELVVYKNHLLNKVGTVKLFEDGIIDDTLIGKSLKELAKCNIVDLHDDEGNIMVFVCNVYLDEDQREQLERSGYCYCTKTSDIRMVLCGSINLNLKKHYGIEDDSAKATKTIFNKIKEEYKRKHTKQQQLQKKEEQMSRDVMRKEKWLKVREMAEKKAMSAD